MAIKGADLLHVGNQVLIERAQTAGPGQVNLSPQKVYELGNYQSIGTVFDIPDLTFSVESFDVSTSFEALLNNTTGLGTTGEKFDPAASFPIDVLSEFKPGRQATDPYAAVASCVMPYLVLESISYKFGLKDNATQTFGLRGDSIYYNPGSAYQEEFAGTNAANQVITPAHPAFPYKGDLINGTKYMLGVRLKSGKRLRFGTDYTEVAVANLTYPGSFDLTVTILAAVPTTDSIEIVYSSPVIEDFLQSVHTVPTATRPAAIRGRDIEVFVGGVLLTNRWTSVQSVQVDWKVNLDRNEEFGNYQLVDSDFFVPDVTGSVTVRPRDPNELLAKVRQAAGITSATEVAGALATVTLPVVIKLHSPSDGSVLKTLEIPDARILVPAYSGKVQTKLDVTFQIQSDTGVLNVYHGDKP